MSGVRFKAEYSGDVVRQVQVALEGVKVGVQNTVLRAAIRKACGPLAKAAKQNAPTRKRRAKDGPTGLLKKSIGFRVVRTKRGVIVGLVGSRRRFMGYAGKKKRVPANYAHLVEFGHRIAVGGKLLRIEQPGKRRRSQANETIVGSSGFVPGRPFMRPAWTAGKRQAQETIRNEVRLGIARIAKRYAAKGKSIYA